MSWWQRKINKRIKSSEQRSGRRGDSSERWLIVGLGNPGAQYEKSWHNLGFMALDKIAERSGIKMGRLRFQGMTGEGTIEGERVILLKPLTYMNNSGQSVAEASRFYKIPPEKIVVLLDDIDIETGKIRLRSQGSSGSHKGLKSIVSHLGSEDFYRIRIGMGPRPQGDMVDIVLASIPAAQRDVVARVLQDTALCLETLLSSGLEFAQSRYN
ncbi:MAG: aminoacyl-tRNA hydrolase [Clostridiaceae bacterium]|nr:aminoacyl-tRNA hydrolase [Clostridiaceae bacterium]